MSFSVAASTPKTTPIPPSQASTSTTAATTLLSCVSCRSRKIKCSKTQPICTACQRSKIECVYPARTRLPRGKQGGFRARNAELSRRLNRLEGLVGKLGIEHASLLDYSDPEASGEDVRETQQPETLEVGKSYAPSAPRASEPILTSDGIQYMNSNFWSSLSQEVDGLKQLLNEPSDDEEDTEDASPESMLGSKASSEYAPTPFIFNSNVEYRELRDFHPPSPQMVFLCDNYFRRCDPMFKILHKPTVVQLFAKAANNLLEIGSAGDECVMFAMYFGSVTSLDDQECMRYFHEGKERLLRRYKYATEVALTNADFLNSMELAPLQALTIYLLCSRVHSNNRDVWTLTALALRVAHALDLPRDGLGHSFPPFEAEMRRRLWWQISILDTRGSEDRASYPMILENTFTTRRPLNINDEDIDPNHKNEPEERLGTTDMTFCLITCETCAIVRRLNYVPPLAGDEELEAYKHESVKLIKERTDYVQSTLLAMPCDPERRAIYQLSSMVAQIAKKKAWLCCQYPHQTSRKVPRSDVNREEILDTAIWILENDLKKKYAPEFLSQWKWYGKVFVQWHPLSVALVQLCLQTTGPNVDHAWDIVEQMFAAIADFVADNRKGTLWKPIKRHYYKARKARTQAVQKEMSAVSRMEFGHNLYENTHSIGVPAFGKPDKFSSMMPFEFSMGPEDEDQVMMHPEGTSGLLENYTPEISGMSLDQDSTNWSDWCEFVNSTYDPNQVHQQNSGGTWNPQFGFWTV